MKLSEKGLKILHAREGFRLKPYLDSKGVPTIAMGNTYYLDGRPVKMNDKPLTYDQANNISKIIADEFASFVNSKITREINQNQFDALVSLAYNIGKGGFSRSTVLKLVNKNPCDPAIGPAFMLWTKDKELIGRRKLEVKQYYS